MVGLIWIFKMNTYSKQAPVNEIYQLRLRIKGISPMIWRRLLIHRDSSIADLHFYIQISFGWSDTYLNQFIIYGKPYGVYHDGGIGFNDNPRHVYLKNFQFRIKEKFTYEYNFFDHWEHEIRVEQQLPVDSKKIYPCCIGGSRLAPIENCGGPNAFMALADYYTTWRIEERLLKSIESHQKGQEELDDVKETFRTLRYWVTQHQCNRRAINDRLHRYANGEDINDLILEGAYDEN